MSPMDRRTLLAGALAGAATISLARAAGKPRPNKQLEPVHREVEKRAGEATARLQEWIRQPSIYLSGNSQNVGMKEGAKLMARLARDAGFQSVVEVPTSGAPVIFGRLDAGAKRTLALYFMWDVKQVEEKEWSVPPFGSRA